MPAAKQGWGSTPSQPAKSGNERTCLCVRWQPTGEGGWMRPGGREEPLDTPVLNSTSHTGLQKWRAARTNPSKSQTMQDSRDTQLEMVNPSDRDLRYHNRKKRKKKAGRLRQGEHQVQDRNMCYLLCTEKTFYSEPNLSRSPNTYFFLQRRGWRGKLDGRKASAGGKVNRHSLLYSGRFIHLVGLIKRQVEFLDI